MHRINLEFTKKIDSGNQVLIKGLFADQKLDSFFNEADNEHITSAINVEGYKAEYKKTLDLYSNSMAKRVSVFGLGKKNKLSNDRLRALSADIIRKFDNRNISTLSIDAKSFNLTDKDAAQAFMEGIVLGQYKFFNYKSKIKYKLNVKTINFIGECDSEALEKGRIVGYGVNYARDLGNHPPNIQTPQNLSDQAVEISKSVSKMKSTIIDVKDFEKMGFGSFYGVARASANVTPAKMILVEYLGGGTKDKPLALVGKGLTFDTGGISLKPPTKMDEMKFDMCGSATVLGVLKVVAELQPKINIIFAIGATENMPGGDAQRPGDIVTAYNGKTIEVLNTDAEGRLVLADVLSYVADKYKPKAMIDFATLTGAVLIALGDRSSGIMGNDKNLINSIQKSSTQTGERVWELPLWEEYSRDIKSNIADIKNLGRGRLAGTISAGAFLKEFVEDIPWVHMDIAGTAWGPKEPSYMPKNGATGVAVRLIYDLIESMEN